MSGYHRPRHDDPEPEPPESTARNPPTASGAGGAPEGTGPPDAPANPPPRPHPNRPPNGHGRRQSTGSSP